MAQTGATVATTSRNCSAKDMFQDVSSISTGKGTVTFGSSFSVGREKIGFNGFKTTSMICADDPPSGSFFGLF